MRLDEAVADAVAKRLEARIAEFEAGQHMTSTGEFGCNESIMAELQSHVDWIKETFLSSNNAIRR